MKRSILLLLAIVFFITFLQAQTDFRPGYVIKLNGDTISGEIDYRGDKLMGEICTFRVSKADSIQRFSPVDISGFRFVESKFYVSKEVKGQKIFLEYLINGRVSIYYLRNQSGDHYYLEKDSIGLMEMPYEEGTKMRNGKEVFYFSNKHNGILTYYMQDAGPGLQTMINKMKKPEPETLIQLAQRYHATVCNDDVCIVYQKKLPLFKVNPEIVGGWLRSGKKNIYDLNTVMYGVLGHFWLPRDNENLYLKTGFLVYDYQSDTGKERTINIPIQLEYMYPKRVVRPRFAIGTDLFTTTSTILSAGANIKLFKSVYLSVNYDLYLFINISQQSEDLNLLNVTAHYFHTGIYLDL